MKEKEYTDFKIMLKEMRNYIIENSGEIEFYSQPFSFKKFEWIHNLTKQVFSIKKNYLSENVYEDLCDLDGLKYYHSLINNTKWSR